MNPNVISICYWNDGRNGMNLSKIGTNELDVAIYVRMVKVSEN